MVESKDSIIADLRRTGIARLGVVPWAQEFVDYLAAKPKWPGHVKARPRAGVWCSDMRDVMAAPHFLDYAKSLTPVAAEYFGEPAHLWSLNAFSTNEETPYIPSIHAWHRDTEADKVLVLFMVGSVVDLNMAQALLKDDVCQIIHGPVGTAWLADTQNLHRGLYAPGERLLIWARYANAIPLAKHSEQLPDL